MLINHQSEFPNETQAIRRKINAFRELEVPPQEFIDLVGGGDYYNMGLKIVYEVIFLCEIRPYSWILEPGCGCARNGRHIAPLLDPFSGRFMGFDIHKPMITWCQEHISSVYPNIRFDYADISNGFYNPKGIIKDAEFVFPYRDNTFDIVFLPALFTHMTKAGFERYLSEIHRVLKPHGRLLSWHCLVERSFYESKQGKVTSRFVPFDDVSWVADIDAPSSFIAFDTEYVLEALQIAGFTVHAKMTGRWDGKTPTGINSHQDRILSTKCASMDTT